MSEEELIKEVLKMREVGFNASEQESLPFLFKEVYKIELGKCSDCKQKAWESLYKWALRRRKTEQTNMAYAIKKEYREKNGVPRNFVFMKGGVRVIVNYTNLTDERARLMLASEYAHAIEGQPDKVEEIVVEVTSPNSSEGVTVSTSENQKADGKPLVKVVKGKLSKQKG